MHRIPTKLDFRPTLANPPIVADNAGLYRIVGEVISRQPDHLAELVALMTAISDAGVDLVEHWDCLTGDLSLLIKE